MQDSASFFSNLASRMEVLMAAEYTYTSMHFHKRSMKAATAKTAGIECSVIHVRSTLSLQVWRDPKAGTDMGVKPLFSCSSLLLCVFYLQTLSSSLLSI